MCRSIVFLVLASHTMLAEAAELPAKLVDLAAWMLTLPVSTQRPGRPDEIEQPLLARFSDAEHFFARDGGVVLRAECGGVATKGSGYPRCELRQMEEGGQREIAWATGDGEVHELSLRVAVTHLPKVKPHVVCAQIHDAKYDVVMVRVEGRQLLVERKPEPDVVLSREYELGTPLDLVIRAAEGRVRLWHDGALKVDWEVARKGCYFKAGCYVQSSPKKRDAPDEYGEVVIERISVR